MIIYYFNSYDVDSWELIEAKIADLHGLVYASINKKKKTESWNELNN